MFKPLLRGDQIFCGNGDTAVCTGWLPRKLVADKFPSPECYGVIGNLYSPTRGIDILIRNLLANPQITKLVLLAVRSEDKNSGGSKCLYDFFVDGYEKGKNINNSDVWLIRSEVTGFIGLDIPEESLDLLRKRMKVYYIEKFRDLTNITDIWSFSSNIEDDKTYENFNYIDFVRVINNWAERIEEHCEYFEKKEVNSNLLPGNLIGHNITGKTIVEAWLKLIYLIRSTGKLQPTMHGGQWQELIDLMVTVTDEPSGFFFPQPNYLPVSEEFIPKYIKQFLSPISDGISYTYGQRITQYFGINQITSTIKKLVANPSSTRAVISLWDARNEDSNNPPCLTQIWFRISDDKKLLCTAIFRSNEMFSAWVANVMGIRSLQQYICEELNRHSLDVSIGALTTLSQSAHIYDDSFDAADEVIDNHYLNLKKNRDYYDPCGNFLVELDKKENLICVTQITPGSGEEVKKFKNTNALALLREIAISSPGIQLEHGMYLGLEIGRAQAAKRDNENYIQD